MTVTCDACGTTFSRQPHYVRRAIHHYCSIECTRARHNAQRGVPLDERIEAKVERMPSGCWEWRGGRDRLGYGHIGLDGRSQCVHRVVYALAHGPIPDAVGVHHRCRNHGCVNPNHLEAVKLRSYTAERFWARVQRGDGCWLWTGPLTRTGYGHAGRRGPAHRASYELTHGPIPEGLEIDHLCRNRACVRPDHLEAVTHVENIRRASVRRKHARSSDPSGEERRT